MKAWLVGPYSDDWVVIMHAQTRGEARRRGALIEHDEFTNMRAVRLPKLDDRIITIESLIDSGFPELVEGEPISLAAYLDFCGCDDCKRSMAEANT